MGRTKNLLFLLLAAMVVYPCYLLAHGPSVTDQAPLEHSASCEKEILDPALKEKQKRYRSDLLAAYSRLDFFEAIRDSEGRVSAVIFLEDPRFKSVVSEQVALIPGATLLDYDLPTRVLLLLFPIEQANQVMELPHVRTINANRLLDLPIAHTAPSRTNRPEQVVIEDPSDLEHAFQSNDGRYSVIVFLGERQGREITLRQIEEIQSVGVVEIGTQNKIALLLLNPAALPQILQHPNVQMVYANRHLQLPAIP